MLSGSAPGNEFSVRRENLLDLKQIHLIFPPCALILMFFSCSPSNLGLIFPCVHNSSTPGFVPRFKVADVISREHSKRKHDTI